MTTRPFPLLLFAAALAGCVSPSGGGPICTTSIEPAATVATSVPFLLVIFILLVPQPPRLSRYFAMAPISASSTRCMMPFIAAVLPFERAPDLMSFICCSA